MGATYARAVLMHVTILFGAMLAAISQTKTAAFVLPIVLKGAFDIAAHVRKNFAPQAAPVDECSVFAGRFRPSSSAKQKGPGLLPGLRVSRRQT